MTSSSQESPPLHLPLISLLARLHALIRFERCYIVVSFPDGGWPTTTVICPWLSEYRDWFQNFSHTFYWGITWGLSGHRNHNSSEDVLWVREHCLVVKWHHDAITKEWFSSAVRVPSLPNVTWSHAWSYDRTSWKYRCASSKNNENGIFLHVATIHVNDGHSG